MFVRIGRTITAFRRANNRPSSSIGPTRNAGVSLLAALLLMACSGGGGSASSSAPSIPWSRFRRDQFNSGQGLGGVATNAGILRAFCRLTDNGAGGTEDARAVDTSPSTPAIAIDGTIYVGTPNGLVALHASEESEGDTDSCGPAPGAPAGTSDTRPLALAWRFAGYRPLSCTPTPEDPSCAASTSCEPCTPAPADPTCLEVGSISASPTLTTGRDIVVGSDRGRLFALHDTGHAPTCLWQRVVASAIESSAAVYTDTSDNAITSILLGTGDGYVLALNGDGTHKWRFPSMAPFAAPITASPAMGTDATLYIPAPDGFLYAVDPAGRQKWRVPVGSWQEDDELLPSAGFGLAVFVVGATEGISGGTVFAINPDASLKWRFETLGVVLGSPALARPTVLDAAQFTPTRTPTATPTLTAGTATPTHSFTSTHTPAQSPTISATPTSTPTPTTRVISEPVVYVVDEEGILYGIRGTTGALEGQVDLGAYRVRLSPAISSDFFAVVADEEGFLYARRIDGRSPCTPAQCSIAKTECRTAGDCVAQQCSGGTCSLSHATCTDDSGCETQTCDIAPECGTDIRWTDGRLAVGAVVRSSPIIDQGGLIYVTAADGYLRVFGPPATVEATPTRTATAIVSATQTEPQP